MDDRMEGMQREFFCYQTFVLYNNSVCIIYSLIPFWTIS